MNGPLSTPPMPLSRFVSPASVASCSVYSVYTAHGGATQSGWTMHRGYSTLSVHSSYSTASDLSCSVASHESLASSSTFGRPHREVSPKRAIEGGGRVEMLDDSSPEWDEVDLRKLRLESRSRSPPEKRTASPQVVARPRAPSRRQSDSNTPKADKTRGAYHHRRTQSLVSPISYGYMVFPSFRPPPPRVSHSSIDPALKAKEHAAPPPPYSTQTSAATTRIRMAANAVLSPLGRYQKHYVAATAAAAAAGTPAKAGPKRMLVNPVIAAHLRRGGAVKIRSLDGRRNWMFTLPRTAVQSA